MGPLLTGEQRSKRGAIPPVSWPPAGEGQWQQKVDKGSMGILTGDERNLRDGEASQKLLKSLGKGLPSLLLARTKEPLADRGSGALYILVTSWRLRAGAEAEGRWETRTVLVHLKISISLNIGAFKGWTKGNRLPQTGCISQKSHAHERYLKQKNKQNKQAKKPKYKWDSSAQPSPTTDPALQVGP